MDSTVSAIRNQVLSAKVMRDEIGTRFYPEEIALIKNPEFPCINISFGIEGAGGATDPNIDKVVNPQFRLWVWTKVDTKDAFRIYNIMRTQLSHILIQKFNRNMVCFEIESPVSGFDQDLRAYTAVARWMSRVLKVG